jgi:MYND finger
LLFSFLLDRHDENLSSKLWNIFHDFYLDEEAINMIHSQSEKLVHLLESAGTWENSAYGKVLRIVNDETLHILRDYFIKYSTILTSQSSIDKQFKAAIRKIFRQYYGGDDFFSTLTRSFGVLAVASIVVANHHMKQFWEFGVTDIDDLPKTPLCNPLFLYSSTAGDNFAVNSRINSLATYHLAAFLPDVSSNAPFHQRSERSIGDVKRNVKRVVAGAKLQFNIWTLAFKQQSDRMVIRFVVADPIAFCFALQQRNSSLHVQFPYLSSSQWSATNLTVNANSTPSEFNVIDTTTLIDHIGTLDVLVATTPLLERSPESSISMDSVTRRWSQETELLRQVLCADVALMCAMLGIAPLGYLTGVTTRGLSQDIPTVFDMLGEYPSPVHIRMTWKIPDLCNNVELSKMSCKFEELLASLLHLYRRMSDDRPLPRNGELSSSRPNNYSISSFVALVGFMRRRINANWGNLLKQLIVRCIDDNRDKYADLEIQLHFFGVYSSFRFDTGPLEFGRFFATSRGKSGHGILAHAIPPAVTCIVLTVPRERLHRIYEVSKTRAATCSFHLRIHFSPKVNAKFTNLLPIFGRLINGQVQKDKEGWHGSSDLHVCAYVPTIILLMEDPQSISLNLSEQDVAFRADFGPNLEIFKKSFHQVQLLESAPGYAIPKPIIPGEDESVTADGITLRVFEKAFSKKITYGLDNDRQLLLDGAKVSVDQSTSSPCSITVTVGTIARDCHFQYPVDERSAKLRIARTSGWVEIIVPFSLPLAGNGYAKAPWPVMAKENSICWNIPWINFNTLPRIELASALPWLDAHLESMYSDRERQSIISTDPLIRFKHSLIDVFRCIALFPVTKVDVRFAIKHENTLFVFFITGVFLDPSSHNIISEAYVVEVKPNTSTAELLEQVDFMITPVNPETAKFWIMAVPAMIERCRDWQHNPDCEREGGSVICSCGKGRVGPEFLEVEEWASLAPFVTRCALSPVYPPPYVEQTRYHFLHRLSGIAGDSHVSAVVKHACGHCGQPEATKKCGRCERVNYCGKNCQTMDWKKHKSTCKHARQDSTK